MRFHHSLLPLLGLPLVLACSGGGGGSSSSAKGLPVEFVLEESSLPNGGTWHLNESLELAFSRPLDLGSVSSASVVIETDDGIPAVGTFSAKAVDGDGDGVAETLDESRLVFQPACPTTQDLSDGGLLPEGVLYRILVRGEDQAGQNAIRSADGAWLAESVTLELRTPLSRDPSLALLDTLPGPPTPRVRLRGSRDETGSHFRIGADRRVYVEYDAETGEYLYSASDFEVPRNLQAAEEQQVAFVLTFDQSIDPDEHNLAHLTWEYQATDELWVVLETERRVLTNCAGASSVELRPTGILPSGRPVRVVIEPGFRDITGQPSPAPETSFARTRSVRTSYDSLPSAESGADEFFEAFDFGGTGTLEDLRELDGPRASWGDGVLTANAGFACSGGPNGDFDWIIRSGEIFLFDTTVTQIVGGPGGIPTSIQTAEKGQVEVRSLVVEEGGTLRIFGPYPFVLCATGDVRIEGRIDANGFNAKDVATLNTGHQPEPGGAGGPRGGRGGFSSWVTDGSTPRGGPGHGPLGTLDEGGQGGESGYARAALGKDARRPGGGGGGRFAADFDPAVAGLFAGPGFPGSPESTGAESGLMPAAGGFPGKGPFADDDPGNDFYGVKALSENGKLVGTVLGELDELQGGYGGGGGGDAVPSSVFPQPNWNPASDEKGGPGGGAGGAVHIRTLNDIVFGPFGKISSRGGQGAVGENTHFLDHVGGTGGSGTGGMIVLEATRVDFTDGDPSAMRAVEALNAVGGPIRVGPKIPGDNIPCGISHGGSGGPGLIQVHLPFDSQTPTDDPDGDLVLPTDALLSRDPLFQVSEPSFVTLLPGFGRHSTARSQWMSVGLASLRSDGSTVPFEFLFGGVETGGSGPLGDSAESSAGPSDEGRVRTNARGEVEPVEPVLGPVAFTDPDVVLRLDGFTLELGGESLLPLRFSRDDVYLRTPELLRHCTLSARQRGGPGGGGTSPGRMEWAIADAEYVDGNGTLVLFLADEGTSLQEYVDGAAGQVVLRLVPRFFRVLAGDEPDVIPAGSKIHIRFQATTPGPDGRPDEENVLVDWTADPYELQRLPGGQPGFLRFRVDFEHAGEDITGVPLALDFLRLPFRY